MMKTNSPNQVPCSNESGYRYSITPNEAKNETRWVPVVDLNEAEAGVNCEVDPDHYFKLPGLLEMATENREALDQIEQRIDRLYQRFTGLHNPGQPVDPERTKIEGLIPQMNQQLNLSRSTINAIDNLLNQLENLS